MSRNFDCLSLRTLFDRYYRPRKLLGRSEKNAYQYFMQLRHLARFLGREPTTDDLDDDTLAAFLQWFIDGRDRQLRPRSPETANKARSHLTALWRFAAQVGLVDRWPTIPKIPVPESAPMAWTVEQITLIFNACADARGWLCGIPAADYWIAFHRLLWDTGERSGAMLALRWDWLSRDTLAVPGIVRKANKVAVYVLSPPTLAALERIREPARDLIFPWRLHRSTFYHHYRRLIERAGLSYTRSGPQKMRRSFASHLEAAGGNATAALQHCNRSVTLKSYIDPRIVSPEAAWRKLPKIQ